MLNNLTFGIWHSFDIWNLDFEIKNLISVSNSGFALYLNFYFEL